MERNVITFYMLTKRKGNKIIRSESLDHNLQSDTNAYPLGENCENDSWPHRRILFFLESSLLHASA